MGRESYLYQAPIQEALNFVLMELSTAGESHHYLIPWELKIFAAGFQASFSLKDWFFFPAGRLEVGTSRYMEVCDFSLSY